MTHQEAEQRTNELNGLLKPKYSDLVSHIDLINGTDEINVSFFWNRLSQEKWKDSKSFRIKANKYQETLETKIIPFFE